jgi:hypothetical protein
MKDEIMKKLAMHPFFKEAEAQEKKDLLARRRQWAAQIEALTKGKNDSLPKMKQDLDAKRKKFETQKRALETARTDAEKSRVVFQQAQHGFETKIDNIQGQLLQTAAPEISEAIEYFQGLQNKIRDPGNFRKYAKKSGFFSILKDKTIPARMESNSLAIKKALEYCREAIKALESMKLEAEADLEKIEGLKNGLPDFVNTFSDHSEPRPFEGLPEGINFLGPRPVSETERLLNHAAKQFNI